jgi:hypothetical protein
MINGLRAKNYVKDTYHYFMGKPERNPYSTPKGVACLEGVSMEKESDLKSTLWRKACAGEKG